MRCLTKFLIAAALLVHAGMLTAATVSTPTFNPVAGSYSGSVTLAISCATSGATVKYSLNGGTSTTYAGPLTLAATSTVQAQATRTGMSNSAFATGTYTILVATPTFSPAPGSYSGSARVTIATTTAGATIRYTLDGTEPSTNSSLYAGGLTFTRTTTIKAKAFKAGLSNSLSATGTYTIQKIATFQATPPIIPTGSTLLNNCVQYRTDLTGVVTAGQPQAGVSLRFRSDRGLAVDVLTQPTSPTDVNGKATGRLTTFRQGTAHISDDNVDIDTPVPLAVPFQQALWQSSFYMTGYILASEGDYSGATVTNPPGLTGTWHRDFLYGSGVLMQGSGKDLSGRIITIDWSRSGRPVTSANVYFKIVSCATTASGLCLTAGTTIAVDRAVVPMTAYVNIASVGTRIAQDTGGAIIGYHIDVYRGFGKPAMLGFSNFTGPVQYLSGGGSCN